MSFAGGRRFTGMDRTDQTLSADEMVSAAVAGDEPAFAALAERHRRELHVHCYRRLASFDEAEDAVQETFLNAWRGRSGFEGDAQSVGLLEVESDVPLAPLATHERTDDSSAHSVSAGRLHLDDIGTEVAQQHRTERTGQILAEIDHADPLEWSGHVR